MRYCIIYDDSGHEYLCPVTRKDEANKMIEAIEKYWVTVDYEDLEAGESPEFPDFLKQIDGIHRLTFENPKEE